MKIYDVFYAPAYRQVVTDDGSFDRHVGYYVIAKCKAGKFLYEFMHRDGEYFSVFNLETAEKLVARIREHGKINTQYWIHMTTSDPNELPDYVTNWWRPEYN